MLRRKRNKPGVSKVNPESVPEEVMGALTKDHRGVMNALKKRDGKKWVK